tara:strand:+ start:397 stop:510 length:114 start_codon:yes stop_codon:yes gene_type:complete
MHTPLLALFAKALLSATLVVGFVVALATIALALLPWA